MNVAIDIAALKAAVFNRLVIDAAGAAVRAVLPDGAAGVIDARLLPHARPRAPFLALQRGPLATVEGHLGLASFYWYLYNATEQSYYDINRLYVLFVQAYDPETNPLVYNGSILGRTELSMGMEATDKTLDMLVSRITVAVYC